MSQTESTKTGSDPRSVQGVQEKNRIAVLDFLRGIASLGVVFFHFFNVLNPGFLTSISYYGQLGVQVFFVISGFIIPYSLYRGGYTLRYYGTFVLKRVVRLDPPYIVTVVVIMVLGVLSWYFPFQQGPVFEVSLPQVLLHFAYINVFFGYAWLSDVFWTLAIEFQYYLLIGLVFPLVFSRRLSIRLATFVALGVLSFVIHPPAYIFYYIFLFFMGIWTCQFKLGLIGKKEYALLLALSTVMAILTAGFAATIAAFGAVCAILFLDMSYAIFRFLGSISYSLYLIHSPIGRRALNVLLRVTGAQSTPGRLLVILIAMAFTILAAYLFYLLIERPAQRWSAAFRYRKHPKAEVSAEEIELNPAF
jgi:peptidoglycan/LPS O-acetylase OafA/YrhL